MIPLVAFFLAVVVCPLGGTTAPEPLPTVAPLPRPIQPAHSVPWRYAETVYLECQEEGVPYWIAARLFTRESGFRASAYNRNPNGTEDVGIAQLNTRYIRDWERLLNAPLDPLNGQDSIRVGVRHLAAMYRETGTWSDALAAYNCGLGCWQAGSIPASTRQHVAVIMGEL